MEQDYLEKIKKEAEMKFNTEAEALMKWVKEEDPNLPVSSRLRKKNANHQSDKEEEKIPVKKKSKK